jgi:V8-like Glu-specific endopeptidase
MTHPQRPSPSSLARAVVSTMALLLFTPTLTYAKTITQYIIGGDVESGYPGVGAIIEDGEWSCTGSLIAPTVVLTAAHCLPKSTKAKDLTYFLGIDSNAPATGKTVAVKSIHTHPDNDPNAFDTADVGILVLKEAIHDVPLLPMLTQTMDNSWVGTPALHIGFGMTNGYSEQGGVKHSVWIPISEVMPTGFAYDESGVNTCGGDSGGPALVDLNGTMTIIGVNAYGDEYCEEYGVNTRIDPYQEWVMSFLPEDLDTGSPGSDDDGDDTDPSEGDDNDTTGNDDPADNGGDEDDDLTAGDDDTPTGPGHDSEPGDAPPWTDNDEDTEDTGDNASDWDPCEERGWYDDGVCDAKCPQPDPDCTRGSEVAGDCDADGLADDGVCDPNCASLDPDCMVWADGLTGANDGCTAASPGQATWMFLPFALLLAWQRRRWVTCTG